jgi:hypothetical protein
MLAVATMQTTPTTSWSQRRPSEKSAPGPVAATVLLDVLKGDLLSQIYQAPRIGLLLLRSLRPHGTGAGLSLASGGFSTSRDGRWRGMLFQ